MWKITKMFPLGAGFLNILPHFCGFQTGPELGIRKTLNAHTNIRVDRNYSDRECEGPPSRREQRYETMQCLELSRQIHRKYSAI